MYKILHNPRCRKSREALLLLNENGISVEEGNLEIIEYLKTPPSKEELSRIATLLNLHPLEFTRKNEDAFKALDIDKSNITAQAMLSHMVEYPIIIERPIIIKNDTHAVIGRPPENVMQLL